MSIKYLRLFVNLRFIKMRMSHIFFCPSYGNKFKIVRNIFKNMKYGFIRDTIDCGEVEFIKITFNSDTQNELY